MEGQRTLKLLLMGPGASLTFQIVSGPGFLLSKGACPNYFWKKLASFLTVTFYPPPSPPLNVTEFGKIHQWQVFE